jgi:hypothetical protein
MRRALVHPYTPWIVQLLVFPAFLLADDTDNATLTLFLLPGLVFVWTAFAWGTNRDRAFTRMTESQAQQPKVWMFLTSSIGRQDRPPREPPKSGADELNERIPAAMVIGAWGVVLTGIGIAGLVYLAT